MNRFIAYLTAALAFLLGSAAVLADDGFVDPYAARSAAGDWVLQVDPSSPQGRGSATYRMTRDGKVAWESTLDFTLRQCVVGADGTTAGYAYDTGLLGWPGVGGESSLIVAIIAPDGKVLATHTHARRHPGFPGGLVYLPTCDGVMLDEVSRCVIVRVDGIDRSQGPRWWRYSIVDGAPLEDMKPAAPGNDEWNTASPVDANVVPGTPLTLIHWTEFRQDVEAANFRLVGPTGELVWFRRIPGEYEDKGSMGLSRSMGQGLRQIEVAPSSFSIVSFSEKLRRRYGVAKGDDGTWSISELESEPGEPTPPASAANVSTVPGTLTQLRTVTLGTPASKDIITGINEFSFDGDGHIGWIRLVEGQGPEQRFTLIDQNGATLIDRPVGLPVLERWSQWSQFSATWLDGDRWLIARSEGFDQNATAEAYFFDVRTGDLKKIESLARGTIDRVSRLPRDEGVGFMVSSGFNRRKVDCYDHEGRLLTLTPSQASVWTHNVDDAAVLTDGSIALLTDSGLVHVYRPGVDTPETINAARAIMHEPIESSPYIKVMCADKDAGVIIYDSANDNCLHRIDASGTRWSSIHLEGPNAEKYRVYRSFAVDPDGRIWSSDREHFYRAGEDGRADLTLGIREEGALSDPCALALSDRGWIYALESGTARVHVFNQDGKPISIMRPNAGDTWTQSAVARIKIEPDGRVQTSMGHEAPTVTFGADGTQIESQWGARLSSQSDARWMAPLVGGWKVLTDRQTDESTVTRVGQDGTVLTTIKHRPDGAWLGEIEQAATAGDGSLVVLCTRPDRSRGFAWMLGDQQAWLCAYAPDGEPRATVRLTVPFGPDPIAYDGTRAYLFDLSGIRIVPMASNAVATRIDLPGNVAAWRSMLRPDASIATWKIGSREIQFWTLPN